jgi:hypothetical protein
MREPVFNETLQPGIVVRDLEATMRRYVGDYGIGPWEVHEFNAGKAEDFRQYGQPVERSWRHPRFARSSTQLKNAADTAPRPSRQRRPVRTALLLR